MLRECATDLSRNTNRSYLDDSETAGGDSFITAGFWDCCASTKMALMKKTKPRHSVESANKKRKVIPASRPDCIREFTV